MKKTGEYIELFRSMCIEWKWLLKYVSGYKFQIFVYVVAGLLSTVMGLGVSIAMKNLIDSVISYEKQTIFFTALAAIILGLLQLLVNSAISRLISLVATKVNNEIRYNMYEHIVNSRWEDISKYHSGELLNRIEGDVTTVSGSVVSFIPSVFTKSAQFIGCLAVVLYYDPTMALVSCISIPFLVFSSRLSARMMRKFNEESREMNGKILSFYSESIQNLQTIKAFDVTKRYVEQLKSNLDLYRKMKLDYDKFSILMTLAMSVIGLVVTYTCYGWGVWRLGRGAITYGTMTLFIQLSSQLTASFSALVALIPGSISIATAAGRIMEITSIPLERNDNDFGINESDSGSCRDGVTLRCSNLTYSYNDSKNSVLNNISFTANKGDKVAFVGMSGEGKTTLLRLILGLLKPTLGQLTLETSSGSMPICEKTRRYCSYVPQENAIFSGTIADNLKIVRPEADEKEIEDVLRAAEAYDFVKALPKGIDSVIGEKGVNFSEGQIQRISIARALLKDAALLIMDEATSALDEETERKVFENIAEKYPQKTMVITTHRLAVLKYCTSVYKIEKNGKLVKLEASL